MNKSYDFTDKELIKLKAILLQRYNELNRRILELYDDYYGHYPPNQSLLDLIDFLEIQLKDVDLFINKVKSFLY